MLSSTHCDIQSVSSTADIFRQPWFPSHQKLDVFHKSMKLSLKWSRWCSPYVTASFESYCTSVTSFSPHLSFLSVLSIFFYQTGTVNSYLVGEYTRWTNNLIFPKKAPGNTDFVSTDLAWQIQQNSVVS